MAAREVPFRTTLADVKLPLVAHVLPDPEEDEEEDVSESASVLVEPTSPSVLAALPLRRFSVTCHPTIPPITPDTIAIRMALPISMSLVFPFPLLDASLKPEAQTGSPFRVWYCWPGAVYCSF